jgi:hypothetical protein
MAQFESDDDMDFRFEFIMEDETCFAQALDLIKDGYKLARSGWGDDEWIHLVADQDDDEVVWIGIKTEHDMFMPWTPIQEDILANDWYIVE